MVHFFHEKMATGEQHHAEEDDSDPLTRKIDPSNVVAGELTDETFPSMHRKFQNLVADVPSLAAGDAREDSGISNIPQSPKRVTFSPLPNTSFSNAAVSQGPSASENNSNIKSLTSNMNFKYANSRPDVEEAPVYPSEGSHAMSQRPKISRSMSLTKLFNPILKRTSDSFTLPVPAGGSYPGSAHGVCIDERQRSIKELAQRTFHRSFSVPIISGDGRVSSHGNILRLIPTISQKGKEIVTKLSKTPAYDWDMKGDDGKHISDEEAVCRICLIELGNGAETIEMGCNCKGELALAHQECAIKWFSTKGNRICDVCRQEVQNLPVTLLRMHNLQYYNLQGSRIESAEAIRYSVWQDIPVLVIISMLGYFGFLEQLLAGEMGSGALAISLPFSCILGLLSSIAAATMVWKQYVWIYAIAQFALLIAFSQLFYLELHMEPFLAILLATLSGFGVTMSLSTILVKILRRTRLWLDRSTHQTPSAMQTDGSSTMTNQMQADSRPDLHRGFEEPMHPPHPSPATLNQDVEMGVSHALQLQG